MDLFAVWDAGSVAGAIGGGMLLGAFLASFPQAIAGTPDPEHPRPVASRSALVAMLFLAWVGGIFYAGQIGNSLLIGDRGIDRIISRFLLWLLYSFGVSIGAYVVIRRRAGQTA